MSHTLLSNEEAAKVVGGVLSPMQRGLDGGLGREGTDATERVLHARPARREGGKRQFAAARAAA